MHSWTHSCRLRLIHGYVWIQILKEKAFHVFEVPVKAHLHPKSLHLKHAQPGSSTHWEIQQTHSKPQSIPHPILTTYHIFRPNFPKLHPNHYFLTASVHFLSKINSNLAKISGQIFFGNLTEEPDCCSKMTILLKFQKGRSIWLFSSSWQPLDSQGQGSHTKTPTMVCLVKKPQSMAPTFGATSVSFLPVAP